MDLNRRTGNEDFLEFVALGCALRRLVAPQRQYGVRIFGVAGGLKLLDQ